MPRLSFVIGLLLASCILGAGSAAAEVTVADAWVRGTVPGQRASAAYMRLTASTEATLVSVASPVAKTAEIHDMKMEDGIMKMSAVARLPLPAGKPVELKPGGYHVMLLDLAQPLREGESVPLTLGFTDKAGQASKLEVRAIVRPLSATGPR